MAQKHQPTFEAGQFERGIGYHEAPKAPTLPFQQHRLNYCLRKQARLLNGSGISELAFGALSPEDQAAYRDARIKLVRETVRIDLAPANVISFLFYHDDLEESALAWDLWEGRRVDEGEDPRLVPLVAMQHASVESLVPGLDDITRIYDALRCVEDDVRAHNLPDVRLDSFAIPYWEFNLCPSEIAEVMNIKARSRNFLRLPESTAEAAA